MRGYITQPYSTGITRLQCRRLSTTREMANQPSRKCQKQKKAVQSQHTTAYKEEHLALQRVIISHEEAGEKRKTPSQTPPVLSPFSEYSERSSSPRACGLGALEQDGLYTVYSKKLVSFYFVENPIHRIDPAFFRTLATARVFHAFDRDRIN